MAGPGLRHVNLVGDVLVVLLSLSLVLLGAPVLASALLGTAKPWADLGQSMNVAVMLTGLVIQQFGLVLVAVVGMRRLQLWGNSEHAFRPSPSLWKELRLGLLLGLGLLLVNVLADAASARVFAWWLGDSATLERTYQELAPWQALFGASQPTWTQALAIILIGVAAPVSEEFFFRGFAHSVFRRSLGKAAPIASAALFALIHFYVVHFIPILLLGIILAWIYDWRKNLFTPIVAHAVMNLIVAATVLINR